MSTNPTANEFVDLCNQKDYNRVKILWEEMEMQLTVRVPDEYGEKIAVLAEMMGLKKSDIARLAMKQFIDENLNSTRTIPFQKVKHLLGTAESGIKDLGQRHRYYLSKKIRKGS